MIALPYERSLEVWARDAGMRWDRIVYDRPAAGGRVIAYRLAPRREPRGVIVVAHGAGNDALFAFPGTFKRFLSAGWEVFSFDLDGHGRHSTTVLRIQSVRSAVADAIRTARDGRDGLAVHGFGVSFGGSLLLHALALPTSPLRSAVLACAPLRIRLSLRRALAEFRLPMLRTLLEQRPHSGVWGMVPSFGPVKRAVYPLRLADRPPGAFGYVEALNGILDALDLNSAAARVRVPVLLGYGTADRIVPAEQGLLLHRTLPRSELELLRGATHLTTPFDPRFAARVGRWFAESPEGIGDTGA